MDLGIRGRAALVCGASKGLGRACAEALAAEGVSLTITGRDAAALEEAAASIERRHGVSVRASPGDITTESGRAAALTTCPAPDILINNAGGPPLGDWRSFTQEEWLAARKELLKKEKEFTRLRDELSRVDGVTRVTAWFDSSGS